MFERIARKDFSTSLPEKSRHWSEIWRLVGSTEQMCHHVLNTCRTSRLKRSNLLDRICFFFVCVSLPNLSFSNKILLPARVFLKNISSFLKMTTSAEIISEMNLVAKTNQRLWLLKCIKIKTNISSRLCLSNWISLGFGTKKSPQPHCFYTVLWQPKKNPQFSRESVKDG